MNNQALQRDVRWMPSCRGKEILIVDDYTFRCSGLGKPGSAVRYWMCFINRQTGCSVRATTDGQQLTSIRGEHDHPNDSKRVTDRQMKVVHIYFRNERPDISKPSPAI